MYNILEQYDILSRVKIPSRKYVYFIIQDGTKFTQQEFTASFHCMEQHKKLDTGTRTEKSSSEVSTILSAAAP